MFPNLLRRSLAGLSFEGGFLPSALDRRAVLVALGGLLLAPVLGAYVADEPSLAAALVIAFGVGAVVLGRPHWAAYGVCFGMFFSHTGIRVGVAYLDPGDLCSMALVPLWLLHRFSGSMRPRLISTWWLIPALLGWMLVSMLIAGIPPGVMGRFTREIQMLLTTLALMDLLAQEDRLKIAFWLVAIAAGVEVVLALPEFGTAYRVGGAYKQANQFAHSVAVGAIPVVALFTMYRRRWLRFSLLALLGFMLLGVVLSISRGTYIALSLALLWWVRHNRRQIMLTVLVGVVLGVLVPSVRGDVSKDIGNRLEMKDDSVTHRWATVMNGLNAIEAHPFFGVGYGQFRQIDRSVEVTQQAGRSAHNFYLSVAAATGVPSLLLYFALFGSVMARLRRWQLRFAALGPAVARADSAILVKGAQALMIYLLITSLTKGVGMMLWCTIGLSAAAAQLPLPALKPKGPEAEDTPDAPSPSGLG